MSTPDCVAGIDVSGSEFAVRFGKKGGWFVGRGWFVYDGSGEERLHIRSKRGVTGDFLITDPDGTTVLELRKIGRDLFNRTPSQYLLIDADSEQTLGAYYQREPRSTRWTYAVQDIEEYAVVDLPTIPFGFGTNATISRLDDTPVCRIKYSVFGLKRTLSFDPIHPRLKALVLATSAKLWNSYR